MIVDHSDHDDRNNVDNNGNLNHNRNDDNAPDNVKASHTHENNYKQEIIHYHKTNNNKDKVMILI